MLSGKDVPFCGQSLSASHIIAQQGHEQSGQDGMDGGYAWCEG